MKTRKIAELGMLVATAFILSYLESLLPVFFGIPGIKPGLSNLVVMISLYRDSTKTAVGIALVRILLAGLTFGNLSSMMYSLAGGILSLLVMLLLKRTEKFSIYGVSMAGGVSHNIGQILLAGWLLQARLLVYYLPFLLVAGTAAGLVIGFISARLLERLPKDMG